MAITEMDRDFIMLSFALTECRRAIDNLAQVDELAKVSEEPQPGVKVRENGRIFDRIRLGLQMSASVSRLFWPPRNTVRGSHLRSLTGLPTTHSLSDRTLRNHIEHVDERLDAWTAVSPRPFLTIERVLHDDYPIVGSARDATVAATAIVYDAKNQSIQLFGDFFSLPTLQSQLEDVLEKTSQALVTITSGPGWTSTRG